MMTTEEQSSAYIHKLQDPLLGGNVSVVVNVGNTSSARDRRDLLHQNNARHPLTGQEVWVCTEYSVEWVFSDTQSLPTGLRIIFKQNNVSLNTRDSIIFHNTAVKTVS